MPLVYPPTNSHKWRFFFSDSLPNMHFFLYWWLLLGGGGSSKTCPIFWGFHNPTPPYKAIYTSPPPQAKWTEGSDCWDGALVVTRWWRLGIRRVGPKKNNLKTWILGWWMIWWFVLFNDSYFTLRNWFLYFVSNDLVGWNTQTFSTWCFVWKLISSCLSYQKNMFPFPRKKQQFRTFFLRQSHMINRRQHILHSLLLNNSPLQSLDDWDP